jgi:hypothetical protein
MFLLCALGGLLFPMGVVLDSIGNLSTTAIEPMYSAGYNLHHFSFGSICIESSPLVPTTDISISEVGLLYHNQHESRAGFCNRPSRFHEIINWNLCDREGC